MYCKGLQRRYVSVTLSRLLHLQMIFMLFVISAFTVDAAYTSFYAVEDYPVQKVLREPVYVQVEILERTDPLVVLMLDHCWTTTSPNPHTYPQWDILING